MLGNGRCECFCFDGVTRLGHIRGKMRKKVWITAGDIVLVAKRDFQDEKVDIVHKYTADEARNLKQYGELPETARINETAVDMAMAGTNEKVAWCTNVRIVYSCGSSVVVCLLVCLFGLCIPSHGVLCLFRCDAQVTTMTRIWVLISMTFKRQPPFFKWRLTNPKK